MAAASTAGNLPFNAVKDGAEVEQLASKLENVHPTIPDEVVEYFLARSGFRGADPQVKRIIALAADHFVASIAQTADQSAKQDGDKTLTMEALQQSLLEHDIDIKRPDYWVDP